MESYDALALAAVEAIKSNYAGRALSALAANMALVDLSATGEDNILADARNAAEADLKWRDKQLLRLKDEVFDLEDEQEGVTLAEFSLGDFRADLLHFSRQNQVELEDAPIGISAIVPPASEGAVFDPGVIFCLRRNGKQLAEDQKPVGGLDPFFLVYVRDDGSIRHGFAAPKTILDAMRALCLGRCEPIRDDLSACLRPLDDRTPACARRRARTGVLETRLLRSCDAVRQRRCRRSRDHAARPDHHAVR